MNHIIAVPLHFVLLINVWCVIGEECKPLKVVQNYTISTEANTNAVIIQEIKTTTEGECSDACCNISQSDNCSTTVFVPATGRCSLLACQPVSSCLVLPAVGHTLAFVGFPYLLPLISSYLNASDINISSTTSISNQTLSIGTSPLLKSSSSPHSSKSIPTSTTLPPDLLTSTTKSTTSTTLSLPTTSLNRSILLFSTTQLKAADLNTGSTLSNLNQSLNTMSKSLSEPPQLPLSTNPAEKTTLSTELNSSTTTTILSSLASLSNNLPSHTIQSKTSNANENATTSTKNITTPTTTVSSIFLFSSLDSTTVNSITDDSTTEKSTSAMPPVLLSSLQIVSTQSTEVLHSQSATNQLSASLVPETTTTAHQSPILTTSSTRTFGTTYKINTENIAEVASQPAETSTKGLSGQNNHPKLYKTETEEMSTELIAALSLGIVLTFAVLVICGKRLFDGWQRRNYHKLDYLINGIYD